MVSMERVTSILPKKVKRNLGEGQGETAERLKIINCHLGNGASICAIKMVSL